MAANEAAPHLALLARFLLPRLTAWQLASSTIKGEGDKASSGYVPLEEAVTHQWWSPNTRRWRNVILCDIDRAGWRESLARLLARGLPPPAYAVVSPWKGTAHLAWVLDQPLDGRDPGEIRIRKGIEKGLDAELGGDTQFRRRLTKNPWHRASAFAPPAYDIPCGDPDSWAAHVADGCQLTYHTELGELRTVTAAELLQPLLDLAKERGKWLLSPRPRLNPSGATWCPPASGTGSVKRPEKDPGQAFFHVVAGAVRRARTGDETKVRAILDAIAASWSFALSEPSRVEIVASIAAWMRTKWRGSLDGRPAQDGGTGRRPVDVGVMKGEAVDRGPEALAEWNASTWTERRQAAGRRTGALVKEGHQCAILQARADLLAAGLRPTQAATAQKAKLSLSTVKRAWPHLNGSLPPIGSDGVKRSNLSCGDFPEVVSLPSSSGKNPFPPSPAVVSLVGQQACPQPPSVAVPASHESSLGSRVPEAQETAIACYEAAAMRMGHRGAVSESILPLPADPSPELRAAYRAAAAAQCSVGRRVADRVRRDRAKDKARDRDAWHEAHVGDDAAWLERLSDLDMAEIAAVEAALLRGASGTMLDSIGMAYRSIKAAERRARDRARGVKPKPTRRSQRAFLLLPTLPDATDLQVPW